MAIVFDDARYSSDFIRLNEQSILEHFALEDSDRRLAADPMRIVTDGGHILSFVEDGRVVGVCALVSRARPALRARADGGGARRAGQGSR